MEDPSPLNLAPVAGLLRPLRLYTHDPRADLVSRQLHREGRWEPFETRLLLASLRPGAVAADIGANIGYFSVVLALAETGIAAVHAFEPAADNFALLQRNLALNGCSEQVLANRAALGERGGTAELHRSEDNLGDHQLRPGAPRRQRETVSVLQGDDYFAARAPRLDVIKIDTQGTEMAVIAGLWRTLSASRAGLRILVELTPLALRRAGSSGRELVSRLAELDLPLAIVDHIDGRLVPESAAALCQWCDNVDATTGDEGFMNIFVGEAPAALR